MQRNGIFVLLVMVVGVVAVGLGAEPGLAAPDEQTIELAPTGSEPNASGRARTFVASDRETLDVSALGLVAAANYTIVVDGNEIGTVTSNPGGTFIVRFARNPVGADRQLPAFILVADIKRIDVKNADGVVVLTGSTSSTEPVVPYESTIALTATGVEPAASGHADIIVSEQRDTFEVSAAGLTGRADYVLFVDGAQIVTSATNGSGRLDIRFSDSPNGNELPVPPTVILDNVHLVEIKNLAGQVVLTGSQ
jgi:hypothetical protein